MKLVVQIICLIVALGTILFGIFMSMAGWIGGLDNPEYGIPIIVIGVVLLFFMLFVTRRLTAIQTFGVTVSAILLVAGLSMQRVSREYIVVGPGFAFTAAGVLVFIVLLWRPVRSLIRRAGKCLLSVTQKVKRTL